MAVNPSSKKRKANKSLDSIPRAMLNAVPKNCTKIVFSDLVPGGNYEQKAIIGKINHLYPIGKRMSGFVRKILITDALSVSENSPRKMSVFLLDKFAKESESAEVEGFVIMTNFIVEKLTHHSENDLPVQVLMKKEESKIWFGREVSVKGKKTETSVPPKKQKSPRKKSKVSDEDESQAAVAHHYEYTKLGDLIEREDKTTYNVYGIVDKCDLRITSAKKVQVLNLLLTDQTDTGFPCVVFGGPGETFPDVYPGDIMRIHRMQVYKFRGRLRGRCSDPKFILVFGKNNNEGDKPRTVAKTFTFTPEDITRFRDLFKWNEAKNCPKLISEMERGDFVNFICQVIGVYIARNTDSVIIKVWDGTKTNDFPGVHWGMKEEKLDQRLFTIARDYYVVLFVYGHHTAVAAELKSGQYIEVRDAQLYSPKDSPDDLKLCLHAGNKEGRGITVLTDTDSRLSSLKERLERVISNTLEFGSQADDLLSQNNSIFLNCDISAFTSTQKSDNDDGPALEDPLQPQKETSQQTSEVADDPDHPEVETSKQGNDEDIAVLNDPLSRSYATSQNAVVSVLDVSIKPGQSTQEFGLGMPKDTIPDDENRLSTTSEPDPMCNMTPLQMRYFFHDPLQLPSQATKSIFPTYSNDTEDEWWNSVNAISVTEGHADIKPTSLAEILKYPVPYKFRVLAGVLGFKPDTTSIQKFIHLCCPECYYISDDASPSLESFETREGLPYYFCPECSNKIDDREQWPILQYTFIISLSLHDGTGPPVIEAYLWKENAVKFFKGITPEETLRDSATADSILHMLWNVCPNCKPFDATARETTSVYPILDCCILSYTAANQTQYQIFDTILL